MTIHVSIRNGIAVGRVFRTPVYPSAISQVFFNLLTFDLDLLHAREPSEMTIARRGLKVKVLYDVKVMDNSLYMAKDLKQSTGWAKKTRLFFRLDNFVTVSPRKACSMSKFSQFYREKGTKLAFQ